MALRSSLRQAAVVVTLALVMVGATSVVARVGIGQANANVNTGANGNGDGDADADANADVKQIGQQEIKITDEHVTVSGVDVNGSNLPTVDIDERTYTVHDASLKTDGLTIAYNGQSYQICSMSIVLDDVSVTFENVHIGSE